MTGWGTTCTLRDAFWKLMTRGGRGLYPKRATGCSEGGAVTGASYSVGGGGTGAGGEGRDESMKLTLDDAGDSHEQHAPPTVLDEHCVDPAGGGTAAGCAASSSSSASPGALVTASWFPLSYV